MFRPALALALAALVAALAAAADDPLTLKDYEPKVGDRVRVTEREDETGRTVIARAGTRIEELEKKTRAVVYVTETLAVADGQQTKMRRTYERAERGKDGAVEKLPLHGLTVLIEAKDGKYTFAGADGKPLPPAAARELEGEYANKGVGKKDRPRDDFLPDRPLKVGETWKVDANRMARAFAGDQMTIDPKGVTGTGTLARAYPFAGRRCAAFDIAMSFPITGFRGRDGGNVALKPGSVMTMAVHADGNADGTEPDGQLVMRATVVMSFAVADAEVSVRIDSTRTSHTEAIPPAK